jgi:hypothetical protein
MNLHTKQGLLWLPVLALLAFAGHAVSAESTGSKPKPAAAPASGSRIDTRPPAAAGSPVANASNLEVETRYAAARQAAEQRERDWDRKMKLITKDVCTGC